MLRDGIRGSTVVLTAAICLVLGAGGAAVGAQLITGEDIKNGTVTTDDIKQSTLTSGDIKDASLTADDVKQSTLTSGDIKNDALTTDDIKQGTLTSGDIKDSAVKSPDIKDGTIGAEDLSEAAKASVFSGPNWGIADRNVVGNGDAYLRAGPVVAVDAGPAGPPAAPPFGIGSLGLRTGSPTDKAAFGNQVDLVGMPFADLSQLGYWAYTTGENISADPANLPNLQFEIDANLNAPPSIDFTTANFVPPAQLPGWHQIDAAAEGEWFLTGAEGTATDCNQTTTCSLQELQAAAPDATVFTVQFSKGSDFAYSGAVDGLQINTDLYDFEPMGVLVTPAP